VPTAVITANGDGPVTLSTTYTDAAGNTSTPTTTTLALDTVDPVAPTVTVPNGPDITQAELTANGGLPVSVPLPSNAAAGDVITVTVNGVPFTHTVTADEATAGTPVTVLLSTADVTVGGSGPLELSTTYADVAGNVSTATTSTLTLTLVTPPVAVADTATMTEDETTVGGSVLTNDTNLDTSETTALVGSGVGTNGTIALATNGSYTYTRNGTGGTNIATALTDTFNYTVTDAQGSSSSNSITVSITPANDAPVLGSTTITHSPTPTNTLYSRLVSVFEQLPAAYGTVTVGGVTINITGNTGAEGTGNFFELNDGNATETLTLSFSGGIGSAFIIRHEWYGQQNVAGFGGEDITYALNGTPITPSSLSFYGNPEQATSSATISGNRFVAASGETNAGGIYEQSGTITSFSISNVPLALGSNGSFHSVLVGVREVQQSAGVAIGTLVPAATDVDAGSSVRGYAITSAAVEGAPDTSPGHWQYQNAGGAWVNLDSASTSAAVFLTASTLVRWSDDDRTHTALSAVVVDNSSTAVLGEVLNVSVAGGTTPYSATAATFAAGIGPVTIDLNGDGQIGYSQLEMDVNSDGVLDTTAWVGAQDGVLVWDRYQDGQVHDASQYAFTGGMTDLQALAARFDTNFDGVFSASDAAYADFAVWQDANQNGSSDAGELISLEQLGITSIQLQSDGAQSTPAAGVMVQGQASAAMADGSTLLIHDVLFSYSDAVVNPAASSDGGVAVDAATVAVASPAEVMTGHVSYSSNGSFDNWKFMAAQSMGDYVNAA
jgi:VCBS repeat-containing protein